MVDLPSIPPSEPTAPEPIGPALREAQANGEIAPSSTPVSEPTKAKKPRTKKVKPARNGQAKPSAAKRAETARKEAEPATDPLNRQPPKPIDLFSDLSEFRVDTNLEDAGTTSLPIMIPVRKPSDEKCFRVNPDPDSNCLMLLPGSAVLIGSLTFSRRRWQSCWRGVSHS